MGPIILFHLKIYQTPTFILMNGILFMKYAFPTVSVSFCVYFMNILVHIPSLLKFKIFLARRWVQNLNCRKWFPELNLLPISSLRYEKIKETHLKCYQSFFVVCWSCKQQAEVPKCQSIFQIYICKDHICMNNVKVMEQ